MPIIQNMHANCRLELGTPTPSLKTKKMKQEDTMLAFTNVGSCVLKQVLQSVQCISYKHKTFVCQCNAKVFHVKQYIVLCVILCVVSVRMLTR